MANFRAGTFDNERTKLELDRVNSMTPVIDCDRDIWIGRPIVQMNKVTLSLSGIMSRPI